MRALRLILGDQLNLKISSLIDLNKNEDVVMLCEVQEEATYVKHHKQKIAFLFSAMRHFAEELIEQGITVHYVKLDDPTNTGSFDGEVKRAIKKFKPNKIIVTEPGEHRVLTKLQIWQQHFTIPVEIHADQRFYCSIDEFKTWTHNKKALRMEFFYRDMRKQHSILMNLDNTPIGGKWNYDAENRKPIKTKLDLTKRLDFSIDAITQEVIKLVEKYFSYHFGELEYFNWAINRSQALKALNFFIKNFLPHFGDYQDAMLNNQPFLMHSVLSPYLNAGLLLPQEICAKAEKAYHAGLAPLNAVEGFIRQILGWREYIRGLYWLKIPAYRELNYFKAKKALPEFYWTGATEMNCLRQAITQTKQYAYAHHIQRLMITGNFALLAGLAPQEVCEWYLIVYADAYEWVELPNTLGMALYGDGGLMSSKPYAASANYIRKMSNYCDSCQFKPDKIIGEQACPFNSLYWHFLNRHYHQLKHNQRLTYSYATWQKMPNEKRKAIIEQAEYFLTNLK